MSDTNTPDDKPAKGPKKNLILKFEYDGQQYELSSLTTADTVANLRAVVCSMLSIEDFKRINLKTLQPTNIIEASDDDKPLSEVFRGTRERMIVEEVELPASSNQSATTSRHEQSSSFMPPLKHHKNSPSNLGNDSTSTNRPALSESANQDFNHPSSGQLMPHPFDDSSFHAAGSTTSNESPARQRKLPRIQSDFPVCSSTGYLLRHPVPSNNSCLFISVHYCLTNGIVEDQIGKVMRKIIADTVASDKERFDEAFLGKPNAEYCRWILDDNNWGGAIELSILCKYYETEIVAIDVKNTILNRFGEDSQYPQRMLLLYDGLHYDPINFQPLDENQPIQTLFASENIEVLHLAEELAKEAKQSHQFTDMNTIRMKCSVCNSEMDSKAATEHAKLTGHHDFVEIVN